MEMVWSRMVWKEYVYRKNVKKPLLQERIRE